MALWRARFKKGTCRLPNVTGSVLPWGFIGRVGQPTTVVSHTLEYFLAMCNTYFIAKSAC